jgi:hypothetical protein
MAYATNGGVYQAGLEAEFCGAYGFLSASDFHGTSVPFQHARVKSFLVSAWQHRVFSEFPDAPDSYENAVSSCFHAGTCIVAGARDHRTYPGVR